MSFYVTLPSNGSMSSFPDNKQSNYTTTLNNSLNFNGQPYEVAISEVSIPTHFNVDLGSITVPNPFYVENTNRLRSITTPIIVNNQLTLQQLVNKLQSLIEANIVKYEYTYKYGSSTNATVNEATQQTYFQVRLYEKLASTPRWDLKDKDSFKFPLLELTNPVDRLLYSYLIVISSTNPPLENYTLKESMNIFVNAYKVANEDENKNIFEQNNFGYDDVAKTRSLNFLTVFNAYRAQHPARYELAEIYKLLYVADIDNLYATIPKTNANNTNFDEQYLINDDIIKNLKNDLNAVNRNLVKFTVLNNENEEITTDNNVQITVEDSPMQKTYNKIKISFLNNTVNFIKFTGNITKIFNEPDNVMLVYNTKNYLMMEKYFFFKYIYIYTDIITQQLFSDSYIPLLKTISLIEDGQNNNIITVYSNPDYIDVIKSNISDIKIELRDVTGSFIKFTDIFSHVLIKLHFRPKYK